MTTTTQIFAAFACDLNQQSLSPEVLHHAKRAVIDWYAAWLPGAVVTWATDTSRWCLVVAIAAAGVKTSLGDLEKLGWQPVVMLVVETVVIALFVLTAVLLLQLGQN